ncbi:MAG: VWA domain-containing protein [Phycisphaeraceae bacterium]|nr:VWA domain-containing protein [Phycisphaeraceae bacterium]MCW5763054.1 VWA domain-containing protein [Phycisphaeraceae bacterium]
MHLGAPHWFHALWAAPAVALLWLYARSRTQQLLARFADPDLVTKITSPRRAAHFWVRTIASALATASLAFALVQPQWNEREIPVARKGREIVFVVDVSRSMLARDLAPNRLERAKIWIRDMASVVEGDSIALVAFAGSAVVKCPLTRDIGFFNLALEELSPDSVPVGGSMIGDAIRKTVSQVFERDPTRDRPDAIYRDIILITDGEDQDSLPVEAAESAAQSNIRIITIGLGSDTNGTPIPAQNSTEPFATYRGEVVRSRLDAGALARIAQATPGGVFLNVGTGNIALDDIYSQLIASADQITLETGNAMRYDEMFWAFLCIALAMLVIESFIDDRRRVQP